jgi:conjugal transfer mating pair stabilization protein TraG
LNRDIQDFIEGRYNILDNEPDGNLVLREQATIRNRIASEVGGVRIQSDAVASAATAVTGDNTFVDPRPKNINPPTERAREAAEARRGAINAAYEDNGAFDFGSNPLKQLGRDLARPMIPQPDAPDARKMVGGPQYEMKGPGQQTPVDINATPPKGISTLGRDTGMTPRGSWEMDPEALKNLEKLSRNLDG